MPAETRKAKKSKVSTLVPSDSASQAPFKCQDNSEESDHSELVKSVNYENWPIAKPYLESMTQELVALDQADICTSTYTPQSCQRTGLCQKVPNLNH